MADILADVIHNWTTRAAFPTLDPGKKNKSMAYDNALKLLMMKDDTTDTIASEWSDDTLQLLLAGSQSAGGAKTWNGISTFGALSKYGTQYLGRSGQGIRFDASDNLSIKTNIVRDDDTGVLQLFSGLGGASDAQLRMFGPSHTNFPNKVDILIAGDRKFAINETGEIFLDIPDNQNQALEIITTPGGAKYIRIDTRTGVEDMEFGNATTNPLYSFLSSGQATFKGDLLINGTKKLFLNGDDKGIIQHDNNSLIINNISSSGGDILIEANPSGGDVELKTISGNIILKGGDGNTNITIDNSGLNIASGRDLRLGTAFVGTSDVAIIGSMIIKDSGGTDRKVAIIT